MKELDLSHLSPIKRAFVLKALAKGYNVTQHGNSELFILKGKTAKSRGVMMFGNGTIYRTDVRLDIAKALTVLDAETHLF